MPSTGLSVELLYDEDWHLPHPLELIRALVGENHWNKGSFQSKMAPASWVLATGAGPAIAASLVMVKGPWKDILPKLLAGLRALVKSGWFDITTQIGQESINLARTPSNSKYAHVRAKMLDSYMNSMPYYPLLNLNINVPQSIHLELHFPFPMSNGAAENAVGLLPTILNDIDLEYWGTLVYEVEKEQWRRRESLSG